MPNVCAVWVDKDYSVKLDSPRTVRNLQELNASRDAYCKGIPHAASR